MKFFMILISLLLFCFGGIFLAVANNPSAIIEKVKGKMSVDNLPDETMAELNKFISKISSISFISFVFGICLFVASLFL